MKPSFPPLALFAALFPCVALAAPPAGLPTDVPPRHFAAGAVGRVVHENIMGRDKDGRFRGDRPVTRYELAVALDRFVRYMEAARRPLHAQTYKQTTPIPSAASPTVRHALSHLITGGFLPPDTPLLDNHHRKPVTAQELSDALAAVTIRLSDRAEGPPPSE